jgi:hypothetical protein
VMVVLVRAVKWFWPQRTVALHYINRVLEERDEP